MARSQAEQCHWNEARSAGCAYEGEPAYIMQDEEEQETLAMAHNKDRENYVVVETVMDSGSSDNVTSRATAPHVPVVPSSGSMRGQNLSQAGSGGQGIKNEGEQRLPIYTMDGMPCPMTHQVADVRKSMTSVAKICDRNNRVTFTRAGGIIQNIDNGKCTPFPRRGNIYTLSMMVDTGNRPADPFHGPG